VKVVSNKNTPEIKLAGLVVGPFEEGNEYEIHFWIANELAEHGIVHFREENTFGPTEIYKVQWKERVQVAGQISELPEDFYPRLRRYIAETKKEATRLEKMQEHEKSKQLACDIVNSRLRKIVALSSGPAQAIQITKRMAKEELLIYEQLTRLISDWRNQILISTEEGT
jgi:GINS complex protein helical bundle domain